MKSIIKKIYVLILIGISLGACNPVKHIPPGKVYLAKNKIKVPSLVAESDVLYPYIRQKENKRALWVVKLKMQQYLLFNDSALALKTEKKQLKHQRKNAKRFTAGKDTNDFKPILGVRIKEGGEAPVVFDHRAVLETEEQFQKALFNRGYFHNEIFSELHYNKDSTRVKVKYTTDQGAQFTFNKISLVIDDVELTSSIKEANKGSKLHSGDPFNTDNIDRERARFATEMRNQGYFYFSKEYIAYEVDSALSGNKVDLKIIIKNPTYIDKQTEEAIISPHLKYSIGEITLNTSFSTKYTDQIEDSIHFENLVFVNLSRLKYNPHAFTNKLFFKNGDVYSQKSEERTYSRISGLNNFSYINIGFLPDAQDSTILNCNILMTPMASQSVGIETEGTTSGPNLGISGYLSYSHKNIFGNAEEFKVRIKGGVEAQATNKDTENSSNNIIFNTIEYGIETSLIFQDLILPRPLQEKILRKFNKPKTSLNFVLNYQDRPDFVRRLVNVSGGYFFTKKKEKRNNEFLIYPIDVSYILIDKDSAFEARLEELNNPLISSTYDNQFIVGSRFIETWSNRKSIEQKSHILNRARVELAGTVLSLVHPLIPGENIDDDSNKTIGDVRYAQFFKVQNDWHLTKRINRSHSIAFRVLAGLGVAYGNSESLPYDRSFYGGGANDNRGWRARSLGPGSLAYDNPSKFGVDQVGDVKIQLSAEYRFDIIKSIEGAFFADLGNIWLLKNDSVNRPNANFEIDRFYKELAFAVGPGIRLNFGFLLVRFDWGVKIYDPQFEEGHRFTLSNDQYYNSLKTENKSSFNYNYHTFNLGIGYPF